MTFAQLFKTAMIAAIAMASAIHAAAKDAEPLAPRTEYRGQLRDFTIGINGSGSRSDIQPDVLRLPQATIELEDWLLAYGDLLAAFQKAPADRLFGRAALQIDASGGVVGCKFNDRAKLPLSYEDICRKLEDIPFISALDKSGLAVPGEFTVGFFSGSTLVLPEAPRIPIISRGPPVAFTTPYPPARLDSYGFPPSPDWMRRFYEQPQWRTAPSPVWLDPAPQAVAVGLILAWDGSEYQCLVKANDGNEADGAIACDFAKQTLAPAWPSASRSDVRAVPLYISLSPETAPVAIAPIENRRWRTEMEQPVEVALLTQLYAAGIFPSGREASNLRLHFKANPDGSLEHCRVAITAGSDAMDIKACQIAYETVTLAVAQDLFGKPARYRSLFWNARPED